MATTQTLEAALRALVELSTFGRATTSADRARIGRALAIPGFVWGWLGRRKLLEPVEGADKPRALTQLGLSAVAQRSLGDGAGLSRIERIQAAMVAFARSEGMRLDTEAPPVVSRAQWKENLWPRLRDSSLQDPWPAQPSLHRWIHHLRSSQAFGFNLFGPLAMHARSRNSAQWAWAAEPWRTFGIENVENVSFEFPAAGDPLSEQRKGEPTDPRTRVDVRIDHDGKTTLVEVKLTEAEFGSCSSGHDSDNQLVEFCTAPSWTLEQTVDSCYLRAVRGRTYFERMLPRFFKDGILNELGDDGCPLRGGRYQVLRNLLMAAHVVESEGRDVAFAVVAFGPRLNPPLHSEGSLGDADMETYLAELGGPVQLSGLSTRFIDAELLIGRARVALQNGSGAEWASYLARRYLEPLSEGAPAT